MSKKHIDQNNLMKENAWWHIAIQRAEKLPVPEGERSVPVLSHGSLHIRFYTPDKIDRQTPHNRDELYVIANGSGIFMRDGKRESFGPGDVVFVPAEMDHRFEDFTDNFATWVMFYGPEGGEQSKENLHGGQQ